MTALSTNQCPNMARLLISRAAWITRQASLDIMVKEEQGKSSESNREALRAKRAVPAALGAKRVCLLPCSSVLGLDKDEVHLATSVLAVINVDDREVGDLLGSKLLLKQAWGNGENVKTTEPLRLRRFSNYPRELHTGTADLEIREIMIVQNTVPLTGDASGSSQTLHKPQGAKSDRATPEETRRVHERAVPEPSAPDNTPSPGDSTRLSPEARAFILDQLVVWTLTHAQHRRLCILNGPAGTSQFMITQALTRQLPDCVGATYFFHRGSSSRNNPYGVIPALAQQLARSQPELFPQGIEPTSQRQENDELETMADYMQKWIIDPLKSSRKVVSPLVVAVDGLDEAFMKHADAVLTLLQLLRSAAHQLPMLRILITTHYNSGVLRLLHSLPNQSETVKYCDMREAEDIDQRLGRFIQENFDECDPTEFILPSERPDALSQLICLSGGIPTYARTAVRFLTAQSTSAVGMYDRILTSGSNATLYGKLDALYLIILEYQLGQFVEDAIHSAYINDILTWLALAVEPLPLTDLCIVGIPSVVIENVASALQPVFATSDLAINYQEADTGLFHVCFRTFIQDSNRCTNTAFHVDDVSGSSRIAVLLLRFLTSVDIHQLAGAENLPPQIWSYAIKHWTTHTLQGKFTEDTCQALQHFAESHLGDWLHANEPWNIDGVDTQETAARRFDELTEVYAWTKQHEHADGTSTLLHLLQQCVNGRDVQT
ncbi:hypothetical protein CERSUDRAFT_95072 [Gelatoporia subvermispora B]|uniref:Nephrocystin 3-like N-terminal domain-containing protein n=1 Tax=Ceriporiopsis subvermispora (strain B) TaxID=914234 RepID=M2QXF3_CERS8|nr:hypothetical protein CERSUDRAFT_95072 [Gelatoporia subvermispora B]